MVEEGVADRQAVFCVILSLVSGRRANLCTQLIDEPNSRELLDTVYGSGYTQRATKLTDFVLAHRTEDIK
jgi:hypothetical protein